MTGEVDLWLATRNPKKAAELRRLLSDRVRIRTLSELPGADELEVVEDAPDFRGNAAKKALAVAAFLKTHTSLRHGMPPAPDGAARMPLRSG